MPFRKEKSAPNIIEKVSPGRELTCYISDIEGLFTHHSINANTDKKKWFIYYPGLIISEFWESLPEYSDAAKIYENFKDAVIAQYPDASTTCKYERHNLERVIGKYVREVDNLADLGAFYREFYPKVKHLVTNGHLSNHETGNMFSKGFPNHVWDAIARHLQIKLPDHHPADPYDLADIYAATQFILQGTNKGESTLSSMPMHSFMMLHQLDLPRYCIPSQFPNLSLPFMLKRNLWNHKLKWSISISSLSLGRRYCS